MNSRLIRVLLIVIALGIGVAASYLLKTIDIDLTGNRSGGDQLREDGTALMATLADVRAAQVAYVARGQGEAFWMARVSKLLPVVEQQMTNFGAALRSPEAQADLEPAAAAIENFHKLDARVQDYVKSSDLLLASDLIFSDGLDAVATATRQVQAALRAELRAREAGSTVLKMRELLILGGAAGGVLLILIALGFSGASRAPETSTSAAPVPSPEPMIVTKIVGTHPGSLMSAAKVCNEMARVIETRQLPGLLERAAKVLDASGIIVWVADPSGRELHPAMAVGYSDQVMARMGSIPRDAANAAASAYRAAEMRTASGDDFTNGALVAPLLTADGCLGVLSAEMKGGSEKDESSQALASIFAAQLATLVSSPSSAALTRAAQA